MPQWLAEMRRKNPQGSLSGSPLSYGAPVSTISTPRALQNLTAPSPPPPAQQSFTNRAKPSQNHLNELHHLLGLGDGDCQLLQLILHIAEEFGLLGLQTSRTNTELHPQSRWEQQGIPPLPKLSPQTLSDRDLTTRLRVKDARGTMSWFPVFFPCNIQPANIPSHSAGK